MKKFACILPLVCMAAGLFGCALRSDTAGTIEADRVSVYYGYSSYAMFEEDEAVVAKLADIFSGLRFEETDREMDVATQLNVIFENDGNVTGRFSMDKNGVFWLNGETTCYQVKRGSFDYDEVYGIYENSRQ